MCLPTESGCRIDAALIGRRLAGVGDAIAIRIHATCPWTLRDAVVDFHAAKRVDHETRRNAGLIDAAGLRLTAAGRAGGHHMAALLFAAARIDHLTGAVG
jgi:hypothetical protein